MRRSPQALTHPDLADPGLLSRIAERLKAEFGAQRVIVYGSVARGEATIHSDIDLLVIAPRTEKSYQRMALAHAAIRDLSIGLPVSLIALTPHEVERRLRAGDPFVRKILEFGVEL